MIYEDGPDAWKGTNGSVFRAVVNYPDITNMIRDNIDMTLRRSTRILQLYKLAEETLTSTRTLATNADSIGEE
jgi:hypothetical protein